MSFCPHPAPANAPRAGEIHALATELLAMYGLHDWSFAFNRRKREMGLCLYGLQRIELSLHFVELNGEEAIRETLRHEIAHALVGPGHGHDAVWKQKCREVGAKAERLCYEVKMPEGRWHARCGGCGMLHSRHRRPKHAGGWYCIHCGRDRGRLTWNRAG